MALKTLPIKRFGNSKNVCRNYMKSQWQTTVILGFTLLLNIVRSFVGWATPCLKASMLQLALTILVVFSHTMPNFFPPKPSVPWLLVCLFYAFILVTINRMCIDYTWPHNRYVWRLVWLYLLLSLVLAYATKSSVIVAVRSQTEYCSCCS